MTCSAGKYLFCKIIRPAKTGSPIGTLYGNEQRKHYQEVVSSHALEQDAVNAPQDFLPDQA
jgi:hypothetical protein